MEQVPPKPMTPFDSMNTPHWLHTMKLLIPYTPPDIQRIFAIFIRFQEMRYTMEHFKVFHSHNSPENIFTDLKPYMDPSTQEMLEQMESMMNMMEMMQMMNGADSGNPDTTNPMNMFSDLFNMKGDMNHE